MGRVGLPREAAGAINWQEPVGGASLGFWELGEGGLYFQEP